MFYVNNYRQNKSKRKIFAENIVCFLNSGINFLHNWNRAKTILFYPQFPSRLSVIHKVASSLRYNITNNPEKKHHLTVYWDDTTYRKPNSTIVNLSKKEKVVNINCTDISKSKVENAFYEVFGYSCAVNSSTFDGLLVKKSEINASHDGVIIQGPTKPEDGFIYQKLINNEHENEQVVDMRIPIVNGEIPLIYVKYKPLSLRFAHYRKSKKNTKKPQMHNANSLLSEQEIANIKLFCNKMGLDYGEIDVLRDNDDKKIYIVDVNNTPNGPSVGKKVKKESIRKIASKFKSTYID